MATPFLGEIRYFAFNSVPTGWKQCNGQILQINQYEALFALLGTQFGGDGIRSFALPDLQGRVMVGQGEFPDTGESLPIGTSGGEESVTLVGEHLPAHTHQMRASSAKANTTQAAGSGFAVPNVNARLADLYATSSDQTSPMLGSAQPNQPHSNLAPYLVLTPAIAISGIFPSRN